MTSLELLMQRAQTKAFIQASPYALRLSRVSLVPNGAGGTQASAPSARPPQTVRLLIPSAGGSQGERELVDGQVVQVDYVVLGEWNADIARGDWFYVDGVKFEVVSVRSTGDYEVKAEVTNRG